MSSRRVLAEHSSAELTEWRAFDRAYGLGFVGDRQAGVVAAAVWNAAGGIPEGEKRRRPATPGDFFETLQRDGDDGQQSRVSHDDPEPVDDVDVDVDDDAAEVARASEAMKSMWAMYGLRRNAQLRAAAQLEAGEPPADPDLN